MIKRQLSVHIDFPVLCGVRLELSCSVPEGLWETMATVSGGGRGCINKSWGFMTRPQHHATLLILHMPHLGLYSVFLLMVVVGRIRWQVVTGILPNLM